MNFIDYLIWRGDVSMAYDPFNEIDNMLICQLSYVDFNEILPQDGSMSISDLAERYFSSHSLEDVYEQKTYLEMSPLVLYYMAKTSRFRNCRVFNYVSELSDEKQFAALMLELPDGSTAVCFRGTDDTLVGWKEDLMLSYTSIPSQERALEYLNQKTKPFRKYRVIGHSKGGNLALYAAVHCHPYVQKRIIEVISNDGPGLRPGTYNEEDFRRIAKQTRLIVPEKDGVGTIFEMDVERKVVRSSTRNIVYAHSMFTWQVEANRLVEADSAAYETDVNRQAIITFLNETTEAQRKFFIDRLFTVFEEEKITTVSQLSAFGLALIPRAFKMFSEMDEEAKKIAALLVKTYSGRLSSDAYRSLSDNLNSFIEKRRWHRDNETSE